MFNNNTALIKDKLEIYNLLKNIQKSRQLVSLSFDSLPQHCLTSLIEVDHTSKKLVFDEPNPGLNNKIIATKNEVTFSLKLDKLPVRFKSEIIYKPYDKLDNDINTHFPKEVYYPQNRYYYRFNTEDINDVTATIYLSSIKKLPCQLINISLHGLCLRLPYAFAAMFQVDQYIDDIYIELPNKTSFSVSAKVQNTRIENNYNNIALGLQIEQQNMKTEKTIQKFIFQHENT